MTEEGKRERKTPIMSIADDLLRAVEAGRAKTQKEELLAKMGHDAFTVAVRDVLVGLAAYLGCPDAHWYDNLEDKTTGPAPGYPPPLRETSQNSNEFFVGLRITVPSRPPFTTTLLFTVRQENEQVKFRFCGGDHGILPNHSLATAKDIFYREVGDILLKKIADGFPPNSTIK